MIRVFMAFGHPSNDVGGCNIYGYNYVRLIYAFFHELVFLCMNEFIQKNVLKYS